MNGLIATIIQIIVNKILKNKFLRIANQDHLDQSNLWKIKTIVTTNKIETNLECLLKQSHKLVKIQKHN